MTTRIGLSAILQNDIENVILPEMVKRFNYPIELQYLILRIDWNSEKIRKRFLILLKNAINKKYKNILDVDDSYSEKRLMIFNQTVGEIIEDSIIDDMNSIRDEVLKKLEYVEFKTIQVPI